MIDENEEQFNPRMFNSHAKRYQFFIEPLQLGENKTMTSIWIARPVYSREQCLQFFPPRILSILLRKLSSQKNQISL